MISQADKAIELCTQYRFVHYLAMAKVFRGWARAIGGTPGGIEDIKTGLEGARETGMVLFEPYFLALWAEAYLETGYVEEALAKLDEARDRLREADCDRFYEAEVVRLRGEALVRFSKHQQNQAEHCFLESIKLARTQSNKSLELRAAMSLYSLCTSQGRGHEQRQPLSDLYQSFKEGRDTADLIKAHQLLASV